MIMSFGKKIYLFLNKDQSLSVTVPVITVTQYGALCGKMSLYKFHPSLFYYLQ